MVYFLIAGTIIFTVIGQLLLKRATFELGLAPTQAPEIAKYLARAFLNWQVLGGLASAVLAAALWLGAVSRSTISFAYPFMGLAIVLVLALSPFVFGEHVPWNRWVGVLIVCVGIWVAAQ